MTVHPNAAAEKPVADAVTWLRAHAAPGADLRADTRTLERGDVFLAYPMGPSDSRVHAGDALARGASAIVYQRGAHDGASDAFPANLPGLPALAVDGLDRLAGPIASAWYGEPSQVLKIVGVTGTNGKTSCSHWIAAGLNATAMRCALVGTLGSGWLDALEATGFTTPDAPQLQHSLARFRDAGAQAVAMEVSSHALDQGRVNGTAFDVAVFTNLTQDHLDYHHTFDAYEAAKARLFNWPGLSHAVLNRDDPAGRRLLAQAGASLHTLAYGMGDVPADVRASSHLRAHRVRPTAHGTAFAIASDWGAAEVEVATLGAFNVGNLLAVLGTWIALGMRFDDALAALAALQPVNGRMERLGGRAEVDEPLVVVDYAHTPDALQKTLETLQPLARQRGGKLVCVFGCGGERDAGKRPLMGAIAEQLADAVVLTSDNPRHEAPEAIIAQIAAGLAAPDAARCIEDRASAILQAIRAASRQDVVLLAGRGHETTQDVMGRRRPFSDQEHARLALAARATSTRGSHA